MRTPVFLSLGSNVGDRRANLIGALGRLREHMEVREVSSLYETEPVGLTEQPPFYNLALCARTTLLSVELLPVLQSIERDLGRVPGRRWGPRRLDIDILLHGDLLHDSSVLTIPHPRMTDRAFVLVPLIEIAPDLRHPSSGQPLSAFLSNLDTSIVKRIGSLTP